MATTNKKEHPFKNHQMPFSMRLYFIGMTQVFKVLGFFSPQLAGQLALRLFMTPPNFGVPRKEKALRESATLTFISVRNRDISIRIWGESNKPTILLSHGWGGRSTQFHALIRPLVEEGYRVIGFDAPAHGDSGGKNSNMMDVASIIAEIEKREGPFKAIIGHSFGTSTTLLSIDKFKVKPEKLVLVAYLSDVFWVTDLFGELFALRQSTLQSMRQIASKQFANTYGISWSWKGISPENTIKSVNCELLMIHDKDDHEVPIEQANKLQKAAPQATIMTTSGLGHRKILMSKNVIQSIIKFLNNSA